MASPIRPKSINMLFALVVLLFSALATAEGTFTQSYCSSQNTATDDVFPWTWQSNGKCTDHCNSEGTYAFAVIQYTNCWCTNYIPSTTTDITRCQVDCPGFPDEKCGDKDAGLYIYIELAGQPSGTAGGSQPSSTAVSSATPVPSSTDSPSTSDAATPSSASPSERPTSRGRPPVTITQTVVGEAPTITVTPTRRQTSAAPTSTTPSSSSDNQPSTSDTQPSSTLRTVVTSSAAAPATSIQVVTESGAIVTRTVVYQPTPESSQSQLTNKGSSNTGAIVGGVVGGVAAIAAIVFGIFFLLRRRKKQQQTEQEHQAGITRNTSTMSKAGLLGGRSVATDPHYPPPIATNMSTAGSRHDNDSISPISGSQRRYSQPMMIDSRLNPETVLMYHPSFGNASRESLGSIDDSRDYGRQLNVRNPDPH